jgi:hypothetical protein
VQRIIASRMLIDLGGDHRDALFVAGSGRSGTTWLAQVINYRNDYRLIFEPFHRELVPLCAHFLHAQYLPPGLQDPTYLEPVGEILSGRVRTRWTDRFNKNPLPRRRIVKEIRGNLMLRWLSVNFPEMPIVLILRHPCAVAPSRLTVARDPRQDWFPYVEETLSQPALRRSFLMPYLELARELRTDFEKHVFMWCVENFVPLRQFRSGQLHVLFYEDLCVHPEEEVDRLFDFLGEPYDRRVFRSWKRPSWQSKAHSSIVTGKGLHDGWLELVSHDETRRAIEILAAFGLDRIYSADPMPRRAGVRELMAAPSESEAISSKTR